MKKALIIVIILVLIIVVVSVAKKSYSPSNETTSTPVETVTSEDGVTIQNLAFSPASLSVKVGTAVTWTNKDSMGHTVTASDGSFGSGTLAQGGMYSFVFTTPGTYTYFCSFHPSMKGTVIVTE